MASNKRIRAERVAWYKTLKANKKCARCTETNSVCLDFHHINPKEKKYLIPRMVQNGLSKATILKEISKCILLCANCHRKEHFAQNYS